MTNQWGGAPGGWYADFEWSGSHDVAAGVDQDFRGIDGWSINKSLSAPLAAGGNQVACSVGLYLCEVFASYSAAITSRFNVQLLGDGGSLSRGVLFSDGTSPSGDPISGLLTQFIGGPVLISLGVFVTGADTVTITDLELRISKIA